LSPEEAAAIAADDALLDALGGRRPLDESQQADSAARLLQAWVTDLDAIRADDDRASAPLAPVAVLTPARAARAGHRRPSRVMIAGAVATAVLIPGGVAAAAGVAPLSPYRAVIDAMTGDDSPTAQERTLAGVDQARSALAAGDIAAAVEILQRLGGDPDVLADPALAALVEGLRDTIVDSGLVDADELPVAGASGSGEPSDAGQPGSGGQAANGAGEDTGNGGGSGGGGGAGSNGTPGEANSGSASENAGTGTGNGAGNGKGQGIDNSNSNGVSGGQGTSESDGTDKPAKADTPANAPQGSKSPSKSQRTKEPGVPAPSSTSTGSGKVKKSSSTDPEPS
jgi:uncharacterized membrane protein YgcG